MCSARIVSLAPDHVPALVRVITDVWPDHYGPDGLGDAMADLTGRCGPGLPLGAVALWDEQPIGTVALAADSFGAGPGEGPWLTGLAVQSSHRGQGIAGRLVGHVEDMARARGDATLFTTTAQAAPIFLRRGWRHLRTTADQDGRAWQVLTLSLQGAGT